jgi:hypothetical protein
MSETAGIFLGFVLVVVYLVILVRWVSFADKKLEPRFRQFVEHRMNATIVRGFILGKGLNWEFQSGKTKAKRGHKSSWQLFFWELIAVVSLYMFPVIFFLGVLISIMMLLAEFFG